MHHNIKTVAGCLSRITCDITAPENVDTTLTAFLVYEGESRPATLESADVIIFPAVPYGHYAYEIRCGGKPVAFGHLLVRPSAFPHTDGVVDYSLAVDLSTAEAAHVELTLTPGPRGPKGEKGEQGPQGATGPTGESGQLQPYHPLGGGQPPETLEAGQVYDVGELAVDTDFSVLAMPVDSGRVQTAELWFELGYSVPTITWPPAAIWANGEPVLHPNTAYRIALRREPNGSLILNLAYEYTL